MFHGKCFHPMSRLAGLCLCFSGQTRCLLWENTVFYSSLVVCLVAIPLFKDSFPFYVCECFALYMCVGTICAWGPQRPGWIIRLPETGVPVGYEPVGAGNQIQVLCRRRECAYLMSTLTPRPHSASFWVLFVLLVVPQWTCLSPAQHVYHFTVHTFWKSVVAFIPWGTVMLSWLICWHVSSHKLDKIIYLRIGPKIEGSCGALMLSSGHFFLSSLPYWR